MVHISEKIRNKNSIGSIDSEKYPKINSISENFSKAGSEILIKKNQNYIEFLYVSWKNELIFTFLPIQIYSVCYFLLKQVTWIEMIVPCLKMIWKILGLKFIFLHFKIYFRVNFWYQIKSYWFTGHKSIEFPVFEKVWYFWIFRSFEISYYLYYFSRSNGYFWKLNIFLKSRLNILFTDIN